MGEVVRFSKCCASGSPHSEELAPSVPSHVKVRGGHAEGRLLLSESRLQGTLPPEMRKELDGQHTLKYVFSQIYLLTFTTKFV